MCETGGKKLSFGEMGAASVISDQTDTNSLLQLLKLDNDLEFLTQLRRSGVPENVVNEVQKRGGVPALRQAILSKAEIDSSFSHDASLVVQSQVLK